MHLNSDEFYSLYLFQYYPPRQDLMMPNLLYPTLSPIYFEANKAILEEDALDGIFGIRLGKLMLSMPPNSPS